VLPGQQALLLQLVLREPQVPRLAQPVLLVLPVSRQQELQVALQQPGPQAPQLQVLFRLLALFQLLEQSPPLVRQVLLLLQALFQLLEPQVPLRQPGPQALPLLLEQSPPLVRQVLLLRQALFQLLEQKFPSELL